MKVTSPLKIPRTAKIKLEIDINGELITDYVEFTCQDVSFPFNRKMFIEKIESFIQPFEQEKNAQRNRERLEALDEKIKPQKISIPLDEALNQSEALPIKGHSLKR